MICRSLTFKDAQANRCQWQGVLLTSYLTLIWGRLYFSQLRKAHFSDKYEVYHETTLQVYGAGIVTPSSHPDKEQAQAKQ